MPEKPKKSTKAAKPASCAASPTKKFIYQDATFKDQREKAHFAKRAEYLHNIRFDIARFLDNHSSGIDESDKEALVKAWEGFGLLYNKYSGKFPA